MIRTGSILVARGPIWAPLCQALTHWGPRERMWRHDAARLGMFLFLRHFWSHGPPLGVILAAVGSVSGGFDSCLTALGSFRVALCPTLVALGSIFAGFG